MVKPIPAVVLGSALVQTIDFSINTLRKDTPIHRPASAPVENAVFLQDIIHNLYRLTNLIDQSELKKLHDATQQDKKAPKLSEAAQQLFKVVDQTKELTTALLDILFTAQAKGSFSDPKWSTAREALTSTPGVWKNSDVKSHKKKFRALRREADTALLLALRTYLEQSKETGLPVLNVNENETSSIGAYLEKWQSAAVDAIQTHDWKSGKKKHVDEFSKLVDELVEKERLAYFVESVFELLWFEELDERVNSVTRPMEGSFEWIFREKNREVGGLLEWLANVRGEGVFWVTGKPGAGKTMLMKHILRNPRVFPYLESWSGNVPGIISGYFALNTGTVLQKSTLGLLRSILYESLQDMIFGPLQQNPDQLQHLFADRWHQWRTYGGGLHQFTVPELRNTFDILVSDTSKRFFFLIDGLDEMDDYPTDIIELVMHATKKDHIKFCVSSHASPIFQPAFEGKPRLFVDDWTKTDIHNYVTAAFNEEPVLETLRGKIDSQQETNIVSIIASKASGVFLWAHIATTFLLQTLVSGDDFLILKDRAEALPPQLSDLLAHILARLDPVNLSHLWMIHVILSQDSYPRLFPLSFALTAETNATFAADVRPLKPNEITKRIEDMRSLLYYRCQNFFRVLDTRPPSQQAPEEQIDPSSLRVTYTHRTIRDFLLANPSTFSALPPQPFNVAEQWANSYLWVLKTLDPSSSSSSPSLSTSPHPPLSSAHIPSPQRNNSLRIWPALSSALSYALSVHASTAKFPLTYTHACLSTAVFQHLKSSTGSDLPEYPPCHSSSSSFSFSPSLLSSSSSSFSSSPSANAASSSSSTSTSPTKISHPFDLALLCNIQAYILLKVKTTEKKDLRHAVEFSREMRKWWGLGGEKAWIISHHPTLTPTGTGTGTGAGTAIGAVGPATSLSSSSSSSSSSSLLSLLRLEYEKPRSEVDAMVEYYLKVTRIGVKKPAVRIPDSY